MEVNEQSDNEAVDEVSRINHNYELLNTQRASQESGVRQSGVRPEQNLAAQEQLINSEVRYRRLFEAARDGVLILDAGNGQIVDANPFLTELLGYQLDELLGYRLWEIGLFRDIVANKEAFLKLQEAGYVRYDNLPLETKDGQRIAVEFVSNVYTEKGRQVIQCNIRDISERKQGDEALQTAHDELEMRVVERTAELKRANIALNKELAERKGADEALSATQQMLQLVMNHIPQAIFWKDRSGLYLGCNDRLASDAGYGSPEEIIGKNDFEMPWAEYAVDYQADDKQVIETDTPKLNIEEPLLKADGSPIWLLTNKIPLHDSKDNVMGVLCSYEDITERKNGEAALREAKAQADAANQAKSEFLSRMSHELRTPLNAILGFGQLLAKQDFAPAQQERVQHILKAGRHLLDLINEVLEISRIEAGHMLLSLESVQVRTTVQEVFALLRPLAAEQGIRLQGSDSSQLEMYVWADLQRFKQVLLNLCSNAIKYNRPQGTITVTCQTISGISSPEDPTPRDQLRINVTDTGVGVALESQEQLFVPFMRVGAAQTTIEGTGLGLALSLSLMHAMGGTIGMESTFGVGSTFWLQLPLTSAPIVAAEDALAHEVAPNMTSASAKATHYTILYIEDNLSNLQLIEAIIDDQPIYELISAMQGQIGLDLARQHHPDLILLDLHLPDVPGDQVLSRLKAEPATAGIPVVMLSAVAMESEIQRLLAGGAVAYLTKPLDIARFLTTLDTILQPDQESV